MSIEPPEDDSDIFFFDFFGNLDAQIKSQQSANFTVPTVELDPVSNSGLVKLRFSDPFIVPDDFTVLYETSTDADGVKQPNLELRIVNDLDDDESRDPVKFTWKVESFTETDLTIRLNFDSPAVVSIG